MRQALQIFVSEETGPLVLIDINKRKHGDFNDLMVEPLANTEPQGQRWCGTAVKRVTEMYLFNMNVASE